MDITRIVNHVKEKIELDREYGISVRSKRLSNDEIENLNERVFKRELKMELIRLELIPKR